MDRFECDGLHDEKWLRSCEEFDSLNENRLISFDQQAICSLLCKLQKIVLTVCTHVPKHLQFAQINKKFQSDVNKNLSVQRSETIVSRKKKIKNWAKAIEKNCNINTT